VADISHHHLRGCHHCLRSHPFHDYRRGAALELQARQSQNKSLGAKQHDDVRRHFKNNQTLCIVTVANLGRRPVTITTIEGYREYPLDPFVVVHSRPNLPHELTEGKHLIAAMPLDEMDVSKVLWWSASDAVGNQYYSKGGSGYARKKYWRAWKKGQRTNEKV